MELLTFQMMQAISFQNCPNLLLGANMLDNMVSKYIEMFLVGFYTYLFFNH